MTPLHACMIAEKSYYSQPAAASKRHALCDGTFGRRCDRPPHLRDGLPAGRARGVATRDGAGDRRAVAGRRRRWSRARARLTGLLPQRARVGAPHRSRRDPDRDRDDDAGHGRAAADASHRRRRVPVRPHVRTARRSFGAAHCVDDRVADAGRSVSSGHSSRHRSRMAAAARRGLQGLAAV